MDELIYFGSAVKALGDGRVGGYLVEFTDYEAQKGTPPDLVREFFTKSTDYDIEPGEKRSVYFDHGQDPVLKRRRLGKAELKADEVGVWAETILDTRDKYLAKIYELAEQGKLGWSSGSAPHLVERAKKSDGFVEILAWPIAEASLTHRPCNPFSAAIPLKSYVEQREAESLDGSDPAPAKAVDGNAVFNESLRQREMRCWELTDALQTGARKIVEGASAENVTGVAVNLRDAFAALVGAFGPRWVDAAVMQADEWLQGDKSEPFYLKSLFDEFNEGGLPAGLPFAERLEMVRAAVERVAADASEIQGMRIKAGRMISAANRTRIQAVIDAINPLLADLAKLMEESEPKQPEAKSAPSIAALRMTTLRLESRIAGVPVSRG